ncbi:unnamed protein product [Closterium sp. NIES-54]
MTPQVRQAAEATLGGVQAPALLTSTVACTENVGAGTSTSTTLTPSVPLTKLLGGGGLTTTLLLLALTTNGATPLRTAATSSATASAASATSSASATSAAAAPSTTATAAAASTAAADTSTSATTPTTTPTPSTASTTTSTAPATPTSAPAPLAPATKQAPWLEVLSRKHARPRQRLSLSLPNTPAMAEINLATLTQKQLDRLVRQLEDSALEIATLTVERDSARQQSTVNAPAQSEEPIVISSGTPTQNDSMGQRSGVASDGAASSIPRMERNRAAPSPQEPCEARRHVEFPATSGEHAIMAPMQLKPQRPLCFDLSQRGGPTVQSWVFMMNVFFYANYIESDATKICYAISLLRGPAMDWWRVIVTTPRAYKPSSQEEGPTGPAVTWISPESSTIHVNPITMKQNVAAGADVYAVDIAVVKEAEQPSDFQKLLVAVPPKLQDLLERYPGIFPDDLPEGLPPQRAHDHRIELEPGEQPTVQRQFRLTQPELDELRKQLDYLLEKEIIRLSSSPFAAPILFTPKKD